jgi:hypothetical protein
LRLFASLDGLVQFGHKFGTSSIPFIATKNDYEYGKLQKKLVIGVMKRVFFFTSIPICSPSKPE